MNHMIEPEQRYVDDDGEVYEVVSVSASTITLQSLDDRLIVRDTEDFLHDVESGDFDLLNDDELDEDDEESGT